MPGLISDSPLARELISVGDEAIATEDEARLCSCFRGTTSSTDRVPTWASMN